MDSLLVFHMAFLAPSETRLVCCPSAAARWKKVSHVVEVMFCTLTLLLCSSGLILCRSNSLITRCLQENMLWFIKCSQRQTGEKYRSETNLSSFLTWEKGRRLALFRGLS